MQARSDLLEGRLLALDWENAVQLSALLAHADEIKFDQRSLNSEDKSITTEAAASTGTATIPTAKAAATTTVPTPGTLSTTAASIANSASSSFSKDTINKSKKRKLSKQKSILDTDDDESDLGTVIIEDYSPLRVYLNYVVRPDEAIAGEMPSDIGRCIAIEHSKIVKMPSKSAKYWLLEEIFKLRGFGEELFSGIIVSSTNGLPLITPTPNCTSSQHDSNTQRCDISVGPHGLLISTKDEHTR